MATRRRRGVDFDADKVRAQAAREGITTIGLLEVRYRERHPEIPLGQKITVIEKAWYGGRADRKYADRLAQSIGLSDCTPLLLGSLGDGPWHDLVTNPEHQPEEPFFHFVTETGQDFRLVRMPSDHDGDDLPRVPVNRSWHLEFLGKRGQVLFILLRSKSRFFQLAPVNADGFSNKFDGFSMRYPETSSLDFEPADGTGWRQFIAIRANRIPSERRGHDTGYECTINDLDLLARRLTSQRDELDIAVDTYEFILTEPADGTEKS